MSIARPAERRGFSFTEILFAIMILGIGFIMVAAMFPVALQQTENSTSETIAAATARNAVSLVSKIGETTFVSQLDPGIGPAAQNLAILRPSMFFPTIPDDYTLYQKVSTGDPTLAALLPPLVSGSQVIPGEVWSLDFEPNTAGTPEKARAVSGNTVTTTPQSISSILYSMTSQNMISTADPRFAWVAMYKRDLFQTVSATGLTFSYAPYVQVIVVAAQARNTDAFTTADVNTTPAQGPSLQLTLIPPAGIPPSVQLVPPGPVDLGWSIQFPAPATPAADRTAEGAFVIIATDSLPKTSPFHGLLNGHIYRLGNHSATGATTWEFAPGFGLTGGDARNITTYMGAGTTFSVYMLGKGRDPNAAAANNYSGPAQDIAVYSTFVPCSSN